MRVAVHTIFAADRREQLGSVLERVHDAFLAAGLGEPTMQFAFSDSWVASFSAVERALKRFPELERFTATVSPPATGVPIAHPARQIGNHVGSPAAGEQVPFATLHGVAAGVPRAYPFHNVSIRFAHPAFGTAPTAADTDTRRFHLQDRMRLLSSLGLVPGVIVGDSWWVNHRQRSLSALTIVEADPGKKKLPPLPESVAAVLQACGKARKTTQVPLPDAAPAQPPANDAAPQPAAAMPGPERLAAVNAVVAEIKQNFADVLDRAAPPHDLPDPREVLRDSTGQRAGPLKPALEEAFGPLGYGCRGGHGTFTLRRRTSGNLTVQITLDVGTWSHSVLGLFLVQGLGFKASFRLPVGRHPGAIGQYPIGDAERWRKIVDNLAALVAELDRSAVPAIESAAGPSPEWYRPEA